MAKQFLEAGRIVGTHGVRGEMRVEPWCDSPEFLKKIKHLYFDEGRQDAGLTASRVHKGQLLIKLDNVNSATEADLYRGKILYLDRRDVRLPKDRYFIEDLIGLSVVDDNTGVIYGELKEVFPTGANNVYRIVNEKGEEFLFPAVDAMIAKTDIENGKLFVRPIPGIFNDDGETIQNTGGAEENAMRIDIVTLFPEMCENLLAESIIGRARSRGHLQVCCHQLRDYGEGVHKRVDDCTFGGGKGMLLMAQPIASAFDAVAEHTGVKPHILYMSPRGRVLNQEKVKELAHYESLIILCGHYEGVDERVLEEYDVEEVSIGDFVLTGGELPAVILTDAVARMLPGVLSEDVCFEEESHFDGLLEYPQYTRPSTWRGRAVPEVLLSGHHENIRRWRRAESLNITRKTRPDLFEKIPLSKEDRKLLEKK